MAIFYSIYWADFNHVWSQIGEGLCEYIHMWVGVGGRYCMLDDGGGPGHQHLKLLV
jgi:hypothetical protein